MKFDLIFKEIRKVIVGQDDMIEGLLIGLLSNGNVLLEGYPGLAKTLAVKTFSEVLDLKFSRIQNTPDLMPSDITGTFILQEHNSVRKFVFQKGPIFANIVLADEINRATPKTQSALLEAMQEKQVTVGKDTFVLEEPFFVLATQNPIEQEGTYPLPEAQADRFLLKLKVSYPSPKEELEIVEKFVEEEIPKVKKVLSKSDVLKLQSYAKQILVNTDLKKRVVKLVALTRNHTDLAYGASPRASIALLQTAKARALIHGRKNVSIDDIKALAKPVLRHRIILSFEAERKNLDEDKVIEELLKKI